MLVLVVMLSLLIWSSARGVSDAAVAQKRIDEGRRQLQLIVDTAAVSITYVDTSETYRFSNKPYAARFGLTPEQIVGRTVREIVGEEAYSWIATRIRTALTGKPMRFQMRSQYAGAVRDLEVAYEPDVSNGEVRGIVVVLEDITERRETEQNLTNALAVAEERGRILDALMEHVPEGITIAAAPDVRIVRVSRHGQELTGQQAEAIEGIPADKHPEVWGLYREDGIALAKPEELPLTRATLSGEVVRNEVWMLHRPDGTRIPILCNAGPLRDAEGRITGGVIAWRDVSELKRVEEDLRRSREQFRIMGDTIPYGAWMTDAQGRNTYISPLFLELVGMTFEEVREFGWTSKLPPEDVAPVMKAWMECVRTGCDWERELRFRGQEGRLHTVLSRGKPVRDSQDRISAWVGIVLDITERKAAEVELQQSKEAAIAANRSKDHFLAVLSHELRTPLTPALAAAQMIEADNTQPDDARRAAGLIRRNIELEARLIDDLLDLTRISRGKLTLQIQVVDVHQSIHQVLATCEADIIAKQLVLDTQLSAKRWNVPADPVRLQQMLWNLIRNAVKFTPVGGSVMVCTSNREDDWLTVSVIDSGVGIDPDRLPHIFDAFEQGDADTARLFGGLGLGLSITKGLADLHGARLCASSRGLGQGATFELDLPLSKVKDDAARSISVSRQTAVLRPSCRILLVEDHRDTASVVARLLERWGHTVAVAHDVAEGIRAAKAAHFDLLISDVGLPDGTGHDLMRQLSPMPGIVLSGYGMKEDISKSKAAGFAEHLVKPVDLDNLRETIARVAAHVAS